MVQEEVSRQLPGHQSGTHEEKKMEQSAGSRRSRPVSACYFHSGVCRQQTVPYVVEKQGNYRVETGIQADAGTSVQLPEQIHDVAISTNYIPDGMTWTDEDHLQYTAQNGGFTFSSVLLDSDDFEKAKEDKNIVESEEHTFGKYEGVYLRYHEVIPGRFL